MIVLLGSNGSMGRRYQAILRFLNVPFQGFDVSDWTQGILAIPGSRGVIVATPTRTHRALITRINQLGASRTPWRVPILCEKPLATVLGDVREILVTPHPLRMMAQYRFMRGASVGSGVTEYDYYRSGEDGLAWDCVTLLGLARGEVHLRQESPIWTCRLNGQALSLGDLDRAYIDAVAEWLRAPEGDRAWMWWAHERAATWMRASGGGRLTGPEAP